MGNLAADLAKLLAAAVLLSGCATRARMCAAPSECGAQASCVAGRCQRAGGVPAIQTSRRIVVEPVAVAYVRRGDVMKNGALPPSFTLGRESDGGARLYLRFSVPIPRETTVIEAYLLLERTSDLDSDPSPITLHAARVVETWDPRSIAWALQPRIEETRSPSTTITSAGRARVRLDVKDLVVRWKAHDRSDQGLVILADTKSPTGVAFAFAPSGNERAPGSLSDEPRAPEGVVANSALGLPPELEIYVK
ncbi:MAG: DNRLRE domain-containing protein [Polyangiaceae bacterium]